MRTNKICFLMLFIMVFSNGHSEMFKEVTKQLGIQFKHDDGSKGDYGFIEKGGSGLAWLDFNNVTK